MRSGLEDGGAESQFLSVDIEGEAGAQMPCPVCAQLGPLDDHEVKRWRHLNFWQHPTYLSARVPRVQCPQHQVKQVSVPWARPASGFTLLFEAFVMALVREMPVSAVAELTAEHDTRLWRIVRHYVARAHARQDWSAVQAVAVDDTATRKGHRYATVVVEIDPQQEQPARPLFMTPERTAASVGQFVAAMPAHGAQSEQVQLAALDLSAAYQKGLRAHLPKAQIVFDRFQVMQLAGKALDEVRKQLQNEGAQMKGALWALRGNESRLNQAQLQIAPRPLCPAPRTRPCHGAPREPSRHLGMARSSQRRDPSQGVVLVGGAQPSGTLQETGPNPQKPLGWPPRLLPPAHHFGRLRVDQPQHPNRPPPRQRLPQLREPQGHLLLDGWPSRPPNPSSFYRSKLANRHRFQVLSS